MSDPQLFAYIRIVRLFNMWAFTTVFSGYAYEILPLNSALLPFIFVCISVGCLSTAVVRLCLIESEAAVLTAHQSNRLALLIMLALIAVYFGPLVFQLATAPSSAWDFLDFWAPIANEISGHATEAIKGKSHQPLLLAATISMWAVVFMNLIGASAFAGPLVWWICLLTMIFLQSYLIVRCAGGTPSISVMAVLLLISMPLFNNHASLFGYTELLALALILVTFLNVICYLRTDRPSWLFFAVLSGAGLFYTRNTGPLFAIAAVLPLILWGPRKAITVVFALVGLAAVVTLAFGVEKSPPNLAYHNGLLQGNVEECPEHSARYLYLRLYGIGEQKDLVLGSNYTELRVGPRAVPGGLVFDLPAQSSKTDALWGVRVQCKGRRGSRFAALETHFLPVAESKFVLWKAIELYKNDDKYVLLIDGRPLKLSMSFRGLPYAIASALILNKSFSVLCISLVIVALLTRKTVDNAKTEEWVKRWWNYTVLITVLTMMVFISLYCLFPYFRQNSGTGMDTIGSRTLFPLLLGTYVCWGSVVASVANLNLSFRHQAEQDMQTGNTVPLD